MGVGYDGDTVRVADDPVAGLDLDVADHRLGADPPGLLLGGAAQGDHRREDREPVRLERVDVADAAVDHEPLQPARLGAGREHLAPVAARGLVADVHDEHRTRRRLRDRDVDREVVGRATGDGEGGGADPRAAPDRVDPRGHRPATALAERRRAELRESAGVVVSHQRRSLRSVRTGTAGYPATRDGRTGLAPRQRRAVHQCVFSRAITRSISSTSVTHSASVSQLWARTALRLSCLAADEYEWLRLA